DALPIYTILFLNSLDSTRLVKQSALVWNGVTVSHIKKFLNNYTVYEKHYKMSNIHLLIEWIERNKADFDNWSVVFSGIEIKEANEESFNIHGYTSKP